jgi:lipopolysaccharide export system protein LptA
MPKNIPTYVCNQLNHLCVLINDRKVFSMLFIFLFFTQLPAWSQTTAQTELVEILKSDSLELLSKDDIKLRKVTNGVFRHNGALLYSNLAIQNLNSNIIEAFGNVKIVQNDTITVTGDTLIYEGNTRMAIVSGKQTVLKDKKRTLTTRKIEYDMQSGIANYPLPGRTVDVENVLTSSKGFYNARTKEFTYYHNVVLVNPKYTLHTDTLLYNSLTKWSYFTGKTEIKNKDGVLNGTKGQYNTESNESSFASRTTVDNPTYTLTADSLVVDGKNNHGMGKGNVVIVAKKDSVVLRGNEAYYDKNKGFSKIFNKPYVRNIISGDTTYIRADTLYSFENNLDSTRILIGNRNVFIYKSDFQGQCDSINYNTADSIIRFFRKPILWGSQHDQMEADSITAFLVNNNINRILLRGKAFVITEDTLLNQHNQVKGRTINAYFESKNKLKQVLVEGNGESAYYAVDDKHKLIGLNRVQCGKMNLIFVDNKVHKISFIGKPDGRLIPPKTIVDTERHLDGFNWQNATKPSKRKTMWLE